jgi:hypothetical protein
MSDMKDYLGMGLILYGIIVCLFPDEWLPFTDVRLVANCVILGLYFMVGVWWIANGSLPDFFYWVFAAGITVVVTFGYAR